VSESDDTTELLRRVSAGDASARPALLEHLYPQLKALAARQLSNEDRTPTLHPTALVHEAWMKIGDLGHLEMSERGHFFAIASQAMRQVLVDHARARLAKKRGGGEWQRVTISSLRDLSDEHDVDDDAEILALHDVLGELEQLNERQARVVEMRFFAGLSVEETAEALGVSPATVKADWRIARGWLEHKLGED
jgi:RNA polymerase sigma-70 factor (ECF subfamily)